MHLMYFLYLLSYAVVFRWIKYAFTKSTAVLLSYFTANLTFQSNQNYFLQRLCKGMMEQQGAAESC